jgi:hypothetical protein
MTPPAQTKKAHLSGASGPSMEVDAALFMKIRCFVATVPDALRHLLQLRPRFPLIPALLTLSLLQNVSPPGQLTL